MNEWAILVQKEILHDFDETLRVKNYDFKLVESRSEVTSTRKN